MGQPRDRDPRASYMTYDSDKKVVRWHRVDYPIPKAQERIVKAGEQAERSQAAMGEGPGGCKRGGGV